MTARMRVRIAVGLLAGGVAACSDETAVGAQPSEATVVTGHVSGFLSERSAAALLRALSASTESIVLVVSPDAIATCEDLGRQLRQVVHAAPSARIIVVALGDRHRTIAPWAGRERIPAATLIFDGSLALEDGTRITAPAVLVATRDGRVLRGVVHANRVPNTRERSFAAELGLK
jgi:hypothetical protein